MEIAWSTSCLRRKWDGVGGRDTQAWMVALRKGKTSQASSLKSSQCNSVCSYRAPLVCPAQQKQRCGDWPGLSCAQRERYLAQVLLVWLCSGVSVDSFSELLWDDQGNSWLCTKQTHLWYNNTEACPSVGGGVLFFRAGDEPHSLGHARQMAYHWATFLAHPSLLTQ